MRGPDTWDVSDLSGQEKGKHRAGHWGTGDDEFHVRQPGSAVDMVEGVGCHRA